MIKLTPEIIAQLLLPVAQENRAKFLYLFDSVARGTATESSDVDLIYELDPSSNHSLTMLDLRDMFQKALGRRVDLIRRDYIEKPRRNMDSERIRRGLLHSIQQHPIYKIL